MKHRVTVLSLIALGIASCTECAPRKPNKRYIEKMSQLKRSRGIDAHEHELIELTAQIDEMLNIAIYMPHDGQRTGTGSGFTYLADAQEGTLTITFDEASPTRIRSRAYNLEGKLDIAVIEETDRSITFAVDKFDADNPTLITIQAVKA